MGKEEEIMFRIIMPVYNAQEYLREAVDSIINQSLPFKENIQIHLIDDASRDGSLEICKEYEREYPENIIVTHFEENRGVSAVRNFGVKKCRYKRGIIAGFVDSDDCLDKNALKIVKEFFENHKDVNLVSSEIYYFGARNGEHKSNWRFEEREIVDIAEDFNYPQYYIGGVFIRRKALRHIRFNEKMSFWEDAMAINQVIIRERKYGLAKGAVYYYRKMENESSLVDKAWKSKDRYTTFLEDGYMSLMKYCKSRRFKVIPYIQFVVAYHLRLFLLESNREAVLEMVSPEEMPAFKESLGKVLENVEDRVIVQMNTALPIIEAELSLKHKKKVKAKRTYTNNDLIFSYGNYELAKLSERNVRIIGVLDKPDYEGMIRGRFSTPIYAMKKDDYIFAENNGQRVKAVRYICRKKMYILDDLVRNYKNAGFAIAIPEEWESATFGIHTQGIDIMLNEQLF